tara:strand:+ start:3863 stop:4606 length:744 start_codon:yes stop_codon:yes gene_type:complete
MQITKPLVFLDVETTGLSVVKDKIVKLSLIKQDLEGNIINGTRLLNPGVFISEEVSQIHGITNEMVKDAPVFKDVATPLFTFIQNTTIVGYSVKRFDWPMLVQHFYKADIEVNAEEFSVLDLREVYMKEEPRTLAGAYKHFLNKEKSLDDAQAMVEIFSAQNDKYSHLKDSVQEIANDLTEPGMVDIANKFVRNTDGKIRFSFGKYDGKTINYVENNDPSYFTWLLNADFFTENTKQVILNNISVKL